MSERRAHVAHCPSSNLKLGSGIAKIPELLSKGINVSLGADGAPCNNTLDMFQEMRLAALMQKPIHGPESMNAETVLMMATVGGAKALGIDGETGSIEQGKKADIVLLDMNKIWNGYNDQQDIYSTIVYSGSPENVQSVMIDGRWVFRDGVHDTLDQEKVVREAKTELNHLLKRIQS
jgi:cytosine/adenosine deaminase-related metal-dependent hydrolase